MPAAMTTIFSIGHSRHTIEAFVALLQAHGIERLVDVRSHPTSKFSPQFGKAPLAERLAAQGIDYVFLGRELGGRPHGAEFYGPDGAVDYERRAGAPEFQAGIERLAAACRELRTAMMCAEEDPGRCHRRRLVAPALQRAGLTVIHVRGDGRLEPEDTRTYADPQLGLFRE